MSPLYTSRALQRTIDLSQLSEVGEPLYEVYSEAETDDYAGSVLKIRTVAFYYRIASSEQIKFQRSLRKGPKRLPGGVLKDQSDVLLTACEEMFEEWHPNGCHKVHVLKDDSGEILAVVNLRKDVTALISAWGDWKAFEQSRQHRSNP